MSGPCKGCAAPTSRKSSWCSQACNALHRRTGVERRCVACGENYYRRPGESAAPKYCSSQCRFDHKRANAVNYPKKGTRAIHRIVMEQIIGRPLSSKEIVHHANHNKLDFSASNLELKANQSVHMKEHWAEGSITSNPADAVARGRKSGVVRRARMLERSLEIERLVAAGRSNEMIAEALCLHVATVRVLRRTRPHCLPVEQQQSLFT